MKLNEILLEYDENKTWASFGSKLLDAGRKDWSIPADVRKDDEQLKAYMLNSIKQSDPTPNQSLSQWIAKAYSVGGTRMEDLMSNVKDSLEVFMRLKQKKKIEPADADINRFKSIADFEAMISKYENVDLTSRKDARKGEAEEKRGESEMVYEDEDIRIIKPKDVDAAMYYGQGTKWCTAAKNNNMYKAYAEQGDLYIIVPKKPDHNGEKYQFHFEGHQFMDERDNPVGLRAMLSRYPTVRQALAQVAKGNAHFILDDNERESTFKDATAVLARFSGYHGGVYWINARNILNHPKQAQVLQDAISVHRHVNLHDDFNDPQLFVLDPDTSAIFCIGWSKYGRSKETPYFNTVDGMMELTPEQAAKFISPSKRQYVEDVLNDIADSDEGALYWTHEMSDGSGVEADEYENDLANKAYDRDYYRH